MPHVERLGLLFSPSGESPGMRSHASNPFVAEERSDSATIFFSPRDERNRSLIASLELRKEGEHLKVSGLSEVPLLTCAEGDYFDRDGTTMGCLVRLGESRFLYYLGWKLESDVPYRTQIGAARYNATNKTFERVSHEPIIGRDALDPHSFSYPWIVEREGGELWMYYGTALQWTSSTESQLHVLRLATSKDGLSWEKRPDPILVPDKDEIAVVRPAVYRFGSHFEMWLCARQANGPYYISRAVSQDGVRWERTDKIFRIPSETGQFDDEMQCYAVRLRLGGENFLLYNGNRYGLTGFGAARLSRTC